MSKRLQVIIEDEELERLRAAARREGLTVSQWVRQTLSAEARRKAPGGDRARKLASVRAAARHSFPTADIEQMLDEIERGYSS